MTIGLLSIPLVELLKLWGELTEALNGCNGFGGDTAELYAYRFTGRSPLAEEAKAWTSRNATPPDLMVKALDERAAEAGSALIALLDLFERVHEVRLVVDGDPAWLDRHRGGFAFVHRVHVQAVRPEGRR